MIIDQYDHRSYDIYVMIPVAILAKAETLTKRGSLSVRGWHRLARAVIHQHNPFHYLCYPIAARARLFFNSRACLLKYRGGSGPVRRNKYSFVPNFSCDRLVSKCIWTLEKVCGKCADVFAWRF